MPKFLSYDDITLPFNFGALTPSESHKKLSSVIILPIPYDSTTSYKSGARNGPNAIIAASRNMELFDMELRREICSVGIHTLPEVEPVVGDPFQMVERIKSIYTEHIGKEKIGVVLGGEHTVSLGAVAALAVWHPSLSVFCLDAHADMRDEYLGSKYSHACVLRRISEKHKFVQVGTRSMSTEEWTYITQNKIDVFYPPDVIKNQNTFRKMLNSLTDTVYITVDMDSFDPSLVPAVGSPEPGGLLWEETLRILRKVISRKKVVGFDLVELCASPEDTVSSFVAAKLAYKLIGYITGKIRR